jgi:hypothetical protein
LIAQTDKKDAIRYPFNSFIAFDTKFVGILAIWLKNVVASPGHHICPRPLMAFASSNVFTTQSVQHAIKLIEIENMSMNYQQLPKSWVVAVMCYCFLHEMHIAHALVTYTAC